MLLTLYLNPLTQLLGLQLVPGMALPVELRLSDVVAIVLAALLLTALAVVYPAWRAVQVEPAAVLRDE